jgi:hypothetical protein
VTTDRDPEGRPALRIVDAEPVATVPRSTGASGSSGYRRFVTILGGIIIAPLAVVAMLTLSSTVSSRLDQAVAARVVDAATLEAEYGIRVNLVAVTADGGLVDLRFTVVDESKAAHLMHDPSTMPTVYVQRSGRVLAASHPLAHKVTVINGASYFLLYPNSGGAVQGGTPVSIVIDDLRTPPIMAQS